MKNLFKNKVLLVLLAVILLVAGSLVVAWLSALYSLEHITFKDVTTTQLAAAMRKDEFWSDYRFNTLIFNGEVENISKQNGKTTVSLKTSDRYELNCEVNNVSSNLKVGNTYKFEAETYQAERQPSGVLLHNCINPWLFLFSFQSRFICFLSEFEHNF